MHTATPAGIQPRGKRGFGCVVILLWLLFGRSVWIAAAEEAPLLNSEGKDGTWMALTKELRANLDGLTLTGDRAARWLPVLRYHCDKIQNHLDMKHLYAELYCNQTATMAGDLKAGKPPLGGWAGTCVPYVYWSDHLEGLQGLQLVVPPEYDPAKEYQFFMYYKMGGSLVWKVGTKWVTYKQAEAKFNNPYHPTLGTCTRLSPDTFHGWSSLNSQVKGRQGAPEEFAEVMAGLSRDFAVSPDRGFASGFSDGGFTPLFLGSRFPHLFAGIAPEVANWQNMNIGTYGWLNIPILVIDGWGDAGYIPENISRFHYLDTMGGDIEAIIGMHGHTPANEPDKTKPPALAGAPYDDETTFRHLMDWARSKRRNLWPKRVRYGTFNLRWNRAYWVTIEDIADPLLGALIDVQVKEQNRIEVKAKNIAAFRLALCDKLVNPASAVTVVVNGTEKYTGAFQPDLRVELVARDPNLARKNHALPGDIMVAMDQAAYADDLRRVGKNVPGQSWNWVRPSGGDEAARRLYGKLFPTWSREDTKVDDKLIQDNHLIVWGGPDVNAFCARVADRLPVKIEKGRFTIGTRVYDQPGQSVRFVCPNPLNPQKYLIVFAWNDLPTIEAQNFYGSGRGFLTPSCWDLREADCQVWGVTSAPPPFSVELAGKKLARTDYYTFDANWRPPAETPVGSFEQGVDYLSLHVLKADAIQEITGAEVAVVGGFVEGSNRWRGFLPAGPVTRNELATIQLFPDYIMTCKMTGAQLKRVLDQALVTTVLDDETDPVFVKGQSLTRQAIQDDRTYTVASDYTTCTGTTAYQFDMSKIKENPAIFKTAADFEAQDGLTLSCSELQQTDTEVTEALEAYIRKRGKVRVRGLCGNLTKYVTNPEVNNCGSHDWAHIKFDIPLADPTQPAPARQQPTLAMGLARSGFQGGIARKNNRVLLQFSETAPCAADLATLEQKLPVTVRTSSKRFALAGSCDKPADLKLAPAGEGQAGEVVLVQIELTNGGDQDLEGLTVLAPMYNSRPWEDPWPTGDQVKDGHPGMYGLLRIQGDRNQPTQQGGVFVLGELTPNYHKDLLMISGTGYGLGLVGLKRALTIRAGATTTLNLVFMAANANDTNKPKPFDFVAVTLALKDQLAQQAGVTMPKPGVSPAGDQHEPVQDRFKIE